MKNNQSEPSTLQKRFSVVLVLASALGMSASAVLAIEKEHLLKNPGESLACDINPVYSCGSVIMTKQASIFGFSNEIFGIMMFAALLSLGVTMLAGGKYKPWLWKIFAGAITLAMGAMLWFFYQSVYQIGALCIYCSIVWFSTWTIANFGLAWCYDNGYIRIPSSLKKLADYLRKNTVGVWLTFILVIVGLILNHFWYYYGQYF